MANSVEPYVQKFGGDARCSRTSLHGDLKMTPATAISATVQPDRGQALVKLGGLQIIGAAEDMEVAAAAFQFCATALTPASVSEPTLSAPTYCKTCTVVHLPDEPCATPGANALLNAAYERMRRTHMIGKQAAGIFVDAAYMFVERGDRVAARILLHQFVLDDVAEEVVQLLVRIHELTARLLPDDMS
jgi:hypothetical protein